MTPRKVPWSRFERSGESVIPAIEKSHQRENRDHLQYLVVIEVTAQLREFGIPYCIWDLAGGLREAKRRAFGLTELGALLKLR